MSTSSVKLVQQFAAPNPAPVVVGTPPSGAAIIAAAAGAQLAAALQMSTSPASTAAPQPQSSPMVVSSSAAPPQSSSPPPPAQAAQASATSSSAASISGTTMNGPMSNGPNIPPPLTLRLIMQGKEVGSIIGKKGDNIKRFREESGCKINISDGSTPERLITMTGTINVITKAYDLICKKFDEDFANIVPKPPITFRLVVPATQCGSLIGKGGSKIKEIRELTGATVQVASEMLPNSTERAVTVSGTAQAIPQCIESICHILLETPVKGVTIPYRPRPAMPVAPVQCMSPQQAAAAAAAAAAAPLLIQAAGPAGGASPFPFAISNDQLLYQQLSKLPPGAQLQPQPAYGLLPQPQMIPDMIPGFPGMAILRPAQAQAPQQMPAFNPNMATSAEINVPNELIGCIIGRGGSKINEIRQLSGATIKIAPLEEGSPERKITITGTADTISLAQYLINTSVEIQQQKSLLNHAAASGHTGVLLSAADGARSSPAASAAATAALYNAVMASQQQQSNNVVGCASAQAGSQAHHLSYAGAPTISALDIFQQHLQPAQTSSHSHHHHQHQQQQQQQQQAQQQQQQQQQYAFLAGMQGSPQLIQLDLHQFQQLQQQQQLLQSQNDLVNAINAATMANQQHQQQQQQQHQQRMAIAGQSGSPQSSASSAANGGLSNSGNNSLGAVSQSGATDALLAAAAAAAGATTSIGPVAPARKFASAAKFSPY